MADNSRLFSSEHHQPVPLWRDIRVLRWLFQLAILALFVLLILTLYSNLLSNLRALGLNLSFEFMGRASTINVSEGPSVSTEDSNWRVFQVGVINTLRVAGLGIVLSTILGTFVGIGRLSRNWLARSLASIYVEVLQNTPVLLQLFFWLVLILALPALKPEEVFSIPADPIQLGPLLVPPLAYFSQRGAAIPGLQLMESFGLWLIFLFAGGLLAWLTGWFIRRREQRPMNGELAWSALVFAVVALLSWLLMSTPPLRLTIPTLTDTAITRYEGGWQLTNSFQAVLAGLTIYTAAFIAEVVRAGIQAVPHGQIEAATALGLTPAQQLRLVILPQALRVIIPPLINQYLNLTKNSSLAIAVAYPDLFNLSQTIGNKTGQNVQILLLVMASYLVMSLSISGVMNIVNRRIQIRER